MAIDTWLIFVLVWFGACILPGPSTAYAVASGVRRGDMAAIYVATGIALAAMAYVSLVGLGLLAFLATSATMFEILRWIGVGYLIYLAWQSWHASTEPARAAGFTKRERGTLVVRATLVAITNPKAMLLYVMVFAPFVTSDAGTEAGMVQLLIIGTTAVAIEFLFYAVLGLLSGRVGRFIKTRRQALIRNRMFALVFAGAGLALAWTARR